MGMMNTAEPVDIAEWQDRVWVDEELGERVDRVAEEEDLILPGSDTARA